MSTTTNNLDLVKPDPADKVQISDINGNMDKIDAAIKEVRDSVGRLTLVGVKSASFERRTDNNWPRVDIRLTATDGTIYTLRFSDGSGIDFYKGAEHLWRIGP